MLNRRVMVGCAIALLVLVAARHPSADIRVLTHDASDPTPHQVKAALDFGVVAVHVLVTWTGSHIS